MTTIDVSTLTATQQWALRECAKFKGGYRFKPKTMGTLAEMGLARPAQPAGYVLTDAGLRAVADLRAVRDAKRAANQRAHVRHA